MLSNYAARKFRASGRNSIVGGIALILFSIGFTAFDLLNRNNPDSDLSTLPGISAQLLGLAGLLFLAGLVCIGAGYALLHMNKS